MGVSQGRLQLADLYVLAASSSGASTMLLERTST
jgi:hypothetical protein